MAVRVQAEVFDVSDEVRRMLSAGSEIGAVVTFTGVVRAIGPDGAITAMTLEHYPGMTEAELERIEAEANARWPLSASLVIHRYGELQPGEMIVLVATASAHRQAAFDAAMFLMDYLKSRAPFWKKEATADGEGRWVDARDCDRSAEARWQAAPPTQPSRRIG
ncbi:MAG: molybdopterin synthase catalytic subunit MoaE [Hyphomicrobium sp.]